MEGVGPQRKPSMPNLITTVVVLQDILMAHELVWLHKQQHFPNAAAQVHHKHLATEVKDCRGPDIGVQ